MQALLHIGRRAGQIAITVLLVAVLTFALMRLLPGDPAVVLLGDRATEATIAQLQAAMASGRTSATELTIHYLNRIQAIDERGPHLNSIIEVNPDALALARGADALRRQGRVLGPLHRIPILLKDNIDPGDRLQPAAGSLALVGRPALRDSTVAAKLRAGGAVILGKANLSENAEAIKRRLSPDQYADITFLSFSAVLAAEGAAGDTASLEESGVQQLRQHLQHIAANHTVYAHRNSLREMKESSRGAR